VRAINSYGFAVEPVSIFDEDSLLETPVKKNNSLGANAARGAVKETRMKKKKVRCAFHAWCKC
jgi:hypothetical protein